MPLSNPSSEGSEFINNLIEQFCTSRGIVQQTTVPYGPEQNGIAERALAIYFEMVRCMLHFAGMDLRYWGEAFLYAVHIRNVSYTSALDGMVPDHAWSGRKPDISHLRIFGSIAYANIPKKLRGGKLQVTAVKCRMLGWWDGETKGYRLEDVETRKLITSRDVRFIEDDRPGDLAVVESNGAPPTAKELNELAPELRPSKDEDQPDANTDTQVTPVEAKTPERKSGAARPTPLSPAQSDSEGSDFEPEPRFEPEHPPDIPQMPQRAPEAAPPPPTEAAAPAPETHRARIASKWTNLPPRDHPARDRRPPERFGQATQSGDTENQERAYIVFSGEPSTYHEAKQSPDSKQWETAIAAEYEQLKATNTFEWVHKVPEGRKAVGSRIVFREKKDGFGKTTKFKARFVAKGFSQVPGRDYNPLSISSTASGKTSFHNENL